MPLGPEISVDHGWGEQPAMSEEADQRPGRDHQTESLTVTLRSGAQNVEGVPQRRAPRQSGRDREDVPVNVGGAFHAAPIQPFGVGRRHPP